MTQPHTRTTSGALAWLSTALRPGNHGAWMLRRNDGDHSEIVTLSLEIPGEGIRAFAGDDIHQAVRRQLPSVADRDRAPSYAHASPAARAVFPTTFPRGTRSCHRSACGSALSD